MWVSPVSLLSHPGDLRGPVENMPCFHSKHGNGFVDQEGGVLPLTFVSSLSTVCKISYYRIHSDGEATPRLTTFF